MLSENR